MNVKIWLNDGVNCSSSAIRAYYSIAFGEWIVDPEIMKDQLEDDLLYSRIELGLRRGLSIGRFDIGEHEVDWEAQP